MVPRFSTAFILLLLAASLPAQRPKIMLAGYWPPSNEAVRQFSTDPQLNPGGWMGGNWQGLGYDVHSFFPTFTPAMCGLCGTGVGQLMVDYQDTSLDFWLIANNLQPMAIITFSRGLSNTWEVEMNQFNRTVWFNDYVAPLQPTPSPPDDSVPGDYLRQSTLPVQSIVNAVLASGVPVIPSICATANAGGFLSEFLGYHGVWYQDLHRWPGDPAWCIAAGHIHIGGGVTWPAAQAAAEVTLRELITHLDGVRATTVCQTDLGLMGPGSAMLDICGGPLNIAGNIADVRVIGAAPNSIGVLAIGTQNNPTPLFGGMAVPVPAAYLGLVVFDAQGSWFSPGALVAPPLPVGNAFAQVAYFDPSLPQGFGLSNALQLTL